MYATSNHYWSQYTSVLEYGTVLSIQLLAIQIPDCCVLLCLVNSEMHGHVLKYIMVTKNDYENMN